MGGVLLEKKVKAKLPNTAATTIRAIRTATRVRFFGFKDAHRLSQGK